MNIMQDQSNRKRISDIYKMLFEMATGNLNFRLSINDNHDRLDNLVALLNKTAAEIQATLDEECWVIPYYSYQNIIQATFILNKNGAIKTFNSEVEEILGFSNSEITNLNFNQLLSEQSIDIWHKAVSLALVDENYHETVTLIFKKKNGQLIPSFCTISKLINSNKVVVSYITTILQDLILGKVNSVNSEPPKKSEALAIQYLYQYILTHLEEPLPSMRQLANRFDTNEHKLKDGFKNIFQKSIYNFYHEERLKKAHNLIRQTEIPLIEIAFKCGFKSYLNFYKGFKKHFGYTPSQLERKTS